MKKDFYICRVTVGENYNEIILREQSCTEKAPSIFADCGAFLFYTGNQTVVKKEQSVADGRSHIAQARSKNEGREPEGQSFESSVQVYAHCC